jgi:starch phosphorylase
MGMWCRSTCLIRILDGNSGWDRGLDRSPCMAATAITGLQQEIVLGMGGRAWPRALGHRVNVYHMNEGHAALLTLALLESELGGGPLGAATETDIASSAQAVRLYHPHAGSGRP